MGGCANYTTQNNHGFLKTSATNTPRSDSICSQKQFTMTLDYLQGDWLSYNLTTDWRLKWKFNGSNTAIEIVVHLLNEENFTIWKTTGVFAGIPLSPGAYMDSGAIDIPYNDLWYIVFFNDDSDQQPTTLTIDIDTIVEASWQSVDYTVFDWDRDLLDDTVRITVDPNLPLLVSGDVLMVFKLWTKNPDYGDILINTTEVRETITGNDSDVFINDLTIAKKYGSTMFLTAGVKYVPFEQSIPIIEWFPDDISTSGNFNIVPMGYGFPFFFSFRHESLDIDSDNYVDSLTAIFTPFLKTNVSTKITVETSLVKKGVSNTIFKTNTNTYGFAGTDALGLAEIRVNMGAVPTTGQYFVNGSIYLTSSPSMKNTSQTDSVQLYVLGYGFLWYPDADGDGFGDADSEGVEGSLAATGYVTDNSDCDDSRSNVYPGALEIEDALDNNCNGQVDENIDVTSDHQSGAPDVFVSFSSYIIVVSGLIVTNVVRRKVNGNY